MGLHLQEVATHHLLRVLVYDEIVPPWHRFTSEFPHICLPANYIRPPPLSFSNRCPLSVRLEVHFLTAVEVKACLFFYKATATASAGLAHQ